MMHGIAEPLKLELDFLGLSLLVLDQKHLRALDGLFSRRHRFPLRRLIFRQHFQRAGGQ
jgi:hypothetical protein